MDELTKDFTIMCENIPVMTVNLESGIYDVISQDYLPWSLKGRIGKMMNPEDCKTRYDFTQMLIASNKNRGAVISWLANRVLSLSRKNAKWIYNLLKVEQVNSDEHKAKIAIMCRALSLIDNYWIKFEDDDTDWEHVNLRHNHLNEAIAQIALHGKSLTIQGSLSSPEFTTDGLYAKAWRRYDDGELWLHKLGEHGDTEARIEVEVSNILDKTNVNHCHYEAAVDEDKYVCACPLMTDDTKSIVSGMDYYVYCNIHDINFDQQILKIDADSIYKMWIVDYLIANRDRHGQNWGFYYDPKTMKISGCHPLFDHNNAFDKGWINNPDSPYQFGDMTVREAAHFAVKRTDFVFTDKIGRSDFITDEHFDCFMKRARELGLGV